MQFSENKHRKTTFSKTDDVQLKAIAYSMDALIPGFYLWLGSLKIRLDASLPEDN